MKTSGMTGNEGLIPGSLSAKQFSYPVIYRDCEFEIKFRNNTNKMTTGIVVIITFIIIITGQLK